MAARNDLPLDELLRLATGAALDDLHVCIPGTVTKYDAAAKRADVRVGVRRAVAADDGGDAYEDLPIVPNVPVGWPGAGGFFLHLPLEVGDTGWLFFSEADAQRWQATGEVSNPREKQRHTMGSPLFWPTPRTPPSTVGAFLACPSAFSFGDPTLAQLLARADKVDAELAKIAATLSTGSCAAAPGPVVFGTPYTPAATACTKAKAE